MTKEQTLKVALLLSALESWAYSQQTRLPDYLGDEIVNVMDILREQILTNDLIPCTRT